MEIRICKQCGKILANQKNIFCNSSCAAKYNNVHRNPIWTDERKKEQSKRMLKKTTQLSDEEIENRVRQKYNPEPKPQKEPEFYTRGTNSKNIGNIGEAKLLFECTKLNIPIYLQFGDNEPADYVIIVEHKPIKIQVKTSTVSHGANHNSIEFRIAKQAKKQNKIRQFLYSPMEVDLFVCYDIKNDALLVVKNDGKKQTVTFNKNINYCNTNNYNEHTFNIDNIKRELEM